MTRLQFVMPFEIYKKDNVCNILQKLSNASIILNNLLMCSDLYRDWVLLKNFQMECRRENSRIEMALTSYEKDGISYEKCYHQGIQSGHMLTLQCHDVQPMWTVIASMHLLHPTFPPPPWIWNMTLHMNNAGDRISRANSSFYVMRMVMG